MHQFFLSLDGGRGSSEKEKQVASPEQVAHDDIWLTTRSCSRMGASVLL